MNQWISIKDKFPPINEKILVRKGNEITMFDPNIFINPYDILINYITHWIPLSDLFK